MAESDSNTNNNQIEIEAVPGTPIELPQGFSVEDGEVVRSGNDLILIGENGQELVVTNYFSLATPPVIVSADGAQFTAQQVTDLALEVPQNPTGENLPGGNSGDGEEEGIETASGPDGEGDEEDGDEQDGEDEDLNDFETAAGEDDPDLEPPSLPGIEIVSATEAAEEQNGSNGAGEAAGEQDNSSPATQQANEQQNNGGDNSNDGDGGNDGDPVVRSNTAPEAEADIGFLQGGNGTTGNVLAGDRDADGDLLKLTEITFEGTVYSFAVDGASDAGGNYLAVNGSSGSLKIYDDGNYEYTKNFGAADDGVSATAGGRNESVTDWAAAGVALTAFNFGTDFTDEDGRFDASLADGSVSTSLFGAGVTGTQGNSGPSYESNEIAYDPLSGDKEALALSFDSEVSEATVTLLRLSATEDTTGEEGNWYAYDADGSLVGQGHIDGSSVTYLNSLIGQITIDTGGIAFQSLVFTGAGYDSGSTAGGGDYYVYDVTYVEAPDGTNSDIADTFGYTVSDGTDTASADLTILEEGVVVPTATDLPTVVVESADGENLDVNALGAVQAIGNSGDDVLDATGSTSTVYLYGGDGNDTLIGGLANDHLFGGDGIDTFVQAADAGTDTIFDFAFGDILVFLGGGFDAAGFTVEQSGDNTVISFDGDDEAAFILHDVDAATFEDYTASVNDDGNLEIAVSAVA